MADDLLSGIRCLRVFFGRSLGHLEPILRVHTIRAIRATRDFAAVEAMAQRLIEESVSDHDGSGMPAYLHGGLA